MLRLSLPWAGSRTALACVLCWWGRCAAHVVALF